jgi:UDP-glucose 6-dehydrogenase
MAQFGHHVGIDHDGHKAREALTGRAPFYEPGLEERLEPSGIISR